MPPLLGEKSTVNATVKPDERNKLMAEAQDWFNYDLPVDALGKALKSSPVDTTVGKIKFDAKGDAEGVGFSVYQVKGGAFAEVK